MSGIAGIFYRDGRPAEQETIDAMVGAMGHRGPHGIHTWREGSVALGHCMLHTTPESLHDKLPMESRDGNLVLTADARIDNREELIRTLRIKPYRDAPLTDCDLILAAYQKWGKECPKHLLGAFAFAIWDKRERQLFCARDHFGVKPFFEHERSSVHVFASEINSILATGFVSEELDRLMIAEHLKVPVEKDVTRTYYSDIKTIDPATTRTISRVSKRSEKYWDPEHIQIDYDMQEQEAGELVREFLIQAVKRRDRGVKNGRLFSLLSGGLDSSSIVAAACSYKSPKSIHTVSYVFEYIKESDESEYIDSVVRSLGVNNKKIFMDKVSPFMGIEYIQNKIAVPCFISTIRFSIMSYSLVNEAGGTSLLHGYGGDEVISHGKGYLYELIYRRNLIELSKQVWMSAKRQGYNPYKVIYSWMVGPVRDILLFDNSNYDLRFGGKKFIDERFLINIEGNLIKPRVYPTTEFKSHIEKITRVDTARTFEIQSTIGSIHGVDVRFPFYDIDLVEFCLSVPPYFKYDNGWPRKYIRNAVRGVLPEKVVWRRSKNDFTPAFISSLSSEGNSVLSDFIQNARDSGVGDYIDLDTILPVMQMLIESPGRVLAGDTVYIWRALSLHLWLKE